MKRLLLIFISVLLLTGDLVFAQVLPDEFARAQSLFSRAQRLMRQRDYPGAIDAYNELVVGFKNSEYRDIYNYGLARAYYHLGDYKMAGEILASFHTLFPNSYLSPYAYHLKANCYYRTGRIEHSFRNYIAAYRTAAENQLRRLSERSINAIIEAGYFPHDSVLAIIPGDLECSVKSRMAFLMKGRWSREQIDSLLGRCPNDIFETEKPRDRSSDGITAGMLTPLSGAYARYGQALLDGAKLAAEKLRSMGVPVEILAYDTRADNVTAARQAIALGESGADIIVGPLLSNVAATTAAVLNNKRIPLLVPAATQAGFTELSSGCFQLSANIKTIGRGLAQYAVRHRGMTTLAVISPASLDELTMAEAFADEAQRLGANILAFERFRPSETDFGPYIRDIKEAILGPVDDSTFYVTLKGDTLRSGEMAVELDGLFIPANEQQLFLILPQLDFYRFNTSYLGTDEWNTEKVLKLGERTLGNAVFFSSSMAMRDSPGYDEFSSKFDAKYSGEPDRLAAVGYDALMILGEAYLQDRKSPGDIAEFLKSLNGYNGVSGKITFGKSRSNLELPLFKYEDGQVKPLIEKPLVEEPESVEPPPDSIGTEVIRFEY
ncbi:MAG: penicillin-binding protein activator [candidate division Zixibacteria bacterium]